MNRKKHSTPPAETLNGCVRFRRTLLFAAVLQAMLPALTACGDTVTSAQATPTAQKAQAAQKPAQKNARPRSPFRVDRGQPRPLRRPRRPAARSGLTGTRAAFPRHRHRSPRMTCRHWGLTRPARPAAEPVMN